MGAERKPSSDERIDADDEGGASSERAITCPRCGGGFERRVPRGNPFLIKKGAKVVCADCGLDCDALKVYRIDEPW